jgi:hypothetical protein
MADCPHDGLAEVPQAVPQDLLSPVHRQALRWGSSLFWIRTWYGNEEVSRDDADRAYVRFCEVVMEEDALDFVDRPWVFEDESRFGDRSGESLTYTGVTHPYVLEASYDYPDRLEASLPSKELDDMQYLDENPDEEPAEC